MLDGNDNIDTKHNYVYLQIMQFIHIPQMPQLLKKQTDEVINSFIC
jgi:hypothetical protein